MSSIFNIKSGKELGEKLLKLQLYNLPAGGFNQPVIYRRACLDFRRLHRIYYLRAKVVEPVQRVK